MGKIIDRMPHFVGQFQLAVGNRVLQENALSASNELSIYNVQKILILEGNIAKKFKNMRV